MLLHWIQGFVRPNSTYLPYANLIKTYFVVAIAATHFYEYIERWNINTLKENFILAENSRDAK